jgi:hypothetical protein
VGKNQGHPNYQDAGDSSFRQWSKTGRMPQVSHFVCRVRLTGDRQAFWLFILTGQFHVTGHHPISASRCRICVPFCWLFEDSIADEARKDCTLRRRNGFGSVVGTMWAMAETDGADLSKHFYQSNFSESTGRKRVPSSYQRSARALQFAVKKLRMERRFTLERWSTSFIITERDQALSFSLTCGYVLRA